MSVITSWTTPGLPAFQEPGGLRLLRTHHVRTRISEIRTPQDTGCTLLSAPSPLDPVQDWSDDKLLWIERFESLTCSKSMRSWAACWSIIISPSFVSAMTYRASTCPSTFTWVFRYLLSHLFPFSRLSLRSVSFTVTLKRASFPWQWADFLVSHTEVTALYSGRMRFWWESAPLTAIVTASDISHSWLRRTWFLVGCTLTSTSLVSRIFLRQQQEIAPEV